MMFNSIDVILFLILREGHGEKEILDVAELFI